jgi:hypothetical protein
MTFTPARVRAPHVMTCVWFWAWAGVGALGILSFDLGPLTAVPALVVGALVASVGDRGRRSAFGLFTGAGLPLLWVAYVQRQGPGTTCWHTASSAGCDQHLNPLPWLIVGIALLLTGLIARTRHNP